MDRGDFVRGDLFGKGNPGDPLVLRKPVEVRRMVLHGERSATCGTMTIRSDHPITALLAAMAAVGWPDSAVQIVSPSGEPLGFVHSFHESAEIARAGF